MDSSWCSSRIASKDGSLFYLVLLFFNTVLIVPFTEELLFRKMALSYFNSSLVFGLLFSSILFALIHIDVNVNFNLLTISKLLIMFLLGIFTGLVYLRYGFTYSFILHATYNFIWYLLNMYRIGYSKLLVDLNFDYRYWLIFGSCLIMLIRTLKKLNLSSPLLKKINS
ncbi:CPBP family intramembrane glutamic endopeptidase [Chryseobacterium sp. S-02]|uniref:CPBP family intramembrane glutamic endopeptidase n=1 Tax=Chryseobacterium sp. S-02 TaxID=3404064 RepID=UPI003CEBD696